MTRSPITKAEQNKRIQQVAASIKTLLKENGPMFVDDLAERIELLGTRYYRTLLLPEIVTKYAKSLRWTRIKLGVSAPKHRRHSTVEMFDGLSQMSARQKELMWLRNDERLFAFMTQYIQPFKDDAQKISCALRLRHMFTKTEVHSIMHYVWKRDEFQ
jgi:hypothetical protein